MAITKNWTRYETTIGWYEVPPSTVLSNGLLLKLLEDSIVYENGEIHFL